MPLSLLSKLTVTCAPAGTVIVLLSKAIFWATRSMVTVCPGGVVVVVGGGVVVVVGGAVVVVRGGVVVVGGAVVVVVGGSVVVVVVVMVVEGEELHAITLNATIPSARNNATAINGLFFIQILLRETAIIVFPVRICSRISL